MTTEETFARELARRADALPGPQLSFEDVRGRAQRIRRRRRAAVAAGVAAAVAAAIFVPSALTSGSGRSAPDPAPSPPPATTTPGASVLHDGVVTKPDGSTVAIDVDNRRVQQLGVLTDGRMVVASSNPYAVLVFGADGSLEAEYPIASNTITLSADDRLAAWLDDTFRVRVLESGVSEPATLPGIPMPGESPGSIDAVFGSDCAGGGCTVLGGDWVTTTTVSTSGGQRDLNTTAPLRVTDVSPDGRLWAVSFPPDGDQQYGCVGLYDPDTGEAVEGSCDTSGLEFSPDGQHLLGGFYENNMTGAVDVLDLRLNRVGGYSPSPDVISRAAWVDAGHVLVAVAGLDDNQWSLVRIGLDGGDPEVLDGPVAGRNPELVTEYLFSE